MRERAVVYPESTPFTYVQPDGHGRWALVQKKFDMARGEVVRNRIGDKGLPKRLAKRMAKEQNYRDRHPPAP